ncbi:MAG: hypothetical protein JXL80_06900 [Planctomycetes bacterium]|nr:hypothetical protein [Planctomycetota bacterium]
MSQRVTHRKSWVVAVLLAMLLPGLGHWYLERRAKATVFFICIVGLFLVGWGLGQWRIVRQGDLLFFAQVLIGALAFLGDFVSKKVISEAGAPDYVRVAFEMGVLYTLVAGFLNLLVVLDAYMVANNIERPTMRKED